MKTIQNLINLLGLEFSDLTEIVNGYTKCVCIDTVMIYREKRGDTVYILDVTNNYSIGYSLKGDLDYIKSNNIGSKLCLIYDKAERNNKIDAFLIDINYDY